MSVPTQLTIAELHQKYQGGMLKPSQVIDHCLEKISKEDGSSGLNAFLHVCAERARSQARQADALLAQLGVEALKKYPLLGIPMGVKDALVIRGIPATAGSKILQDYVPPYTATAVERLELAGAITLGKLNMDEFAMGSTGENSAFGPTLHPTHADRVPGGSSSGSAAAVAAGFCTFALGSDTGGSIRLPANFCGVYGLKPTYGRVSRYGLIAFASSLDQVGPLSITVQDSARVLQVLMGFDPKDSTSLEESVPALLEEVPFQWKGLRIGVPSEYFSEGLSPEVRNKVEHSLKLAQAKGATLVPLSLPHTSAAVATYYVIAPCEASSNLSRMDGVRFGSRPTRAIEAATPGEYYERVRSSFGSEVKRRIILGTFALSSGYYDAYYQQACKVRRLIAQDFAQAFEKVDVIASPVAPTVAFKRGEKLADPLQAYLSDVLTIPASLAGLPGASLPVGMGESSGLPVGVQLLTPWKQEAQLIRISAAWAREVFEHEGVRP